VLHAAAWTDVDGAEDDPQSAAAVNVGGTLNVAALEVPLVTWSTDYVFDGTKREPYLESDSPSPLGAYGRTKLHGEAAAGDLAWVVRTSWLFGPTGHNFMRTMLRLGAERDEVAVVDDQRGSPTYVGHLALRRETARGPISRRRSSRTRVSPRASGGSRPRSSAPGLRAPRTRCCGARRAPPSCLTGARACGPA
jgi:dTDP-4-dehydrorhamnose reductase